MTKHGVIAELAHLRDYQWQGKIHSKIIEGRVVKCILLQMVVNRAKNIL